MSVSMMLALTAIHAAEMQEPDLAANSYPAESGEVAWRPKANHIPKFDCAAPGPAEEPEPELFTAECHEYRSAITTYLHSLPQDAHNLITGQYQTYVLLDTATVPDRIDKLSDVVLVKLFTDKPEVLNMASDHRAEVNLNADALNIKQLNVQTASGQCRGIYSQDAYRHAAAFSAKSPTVVDSGWAQQALREDVGQGSPLLRHGGSMMQHMRLMVPNAAVVPLRIHPGPYAFIRDDYVGLASVATQQSLRWALDNHQLFNITMVSIGAYAGNNKQQSVEALGAEARELLRNGIPVIWTVGPNGVDKWMDDNKTAIHPKCDCWPGRDLINISASSVCASYAETCDESKTRFAHPCTTITSVANALHASEWMMVRGAMHAFGFKWEQCGDTISSAALKVLELTATPAKHKDGYSPFKAHMLSSSVVDAIKFVKEGAKCVN